MGFQTVIAELLAERCGRDVQEMKQLVVEAFSEMTRRRWATLSPQERQGLEAALERARFHEEPPFPAEVVAHIPLSLLPFFVRRVREDLATARAVWWEAYGRYREIQRTLALWYHEERKLQITAAEKKADIDPRVVEASTESHRLKTIVEGLERAEAHLLEELEVRLTLVRSGVLPDPEAVPSNMGRPLLHAV